MDWDDGEGKGPPGERPMAFFIGCVVGVLAGGVAAGAVAAVVGARRLKRLADESDDSYAPLDDGPPDAGGRPPATPELA